VTFSATDAPLKGAELDKFGLVQFPMVMGSVCTFAMEPVFSCARLATAQIRRSFSRC
jgi:phosphate transport system substrate-binding protein